MPQQYRPDTIERFWSKVMRRESQSCWTFIPAAHTGQYGKFVFKRRPIGAHRAAWMLTHGPIPPGMFVLHHCDNRECVNPAHLFLGYPRDNVRDMMDKGRYVSNLPHMVGRRNPLYKLTEEDVAIIRELTSRGISDAEVSRHYNVSKSTIRRVRIGHTWKRVH